jgi:hypothetical protein
MASNGLRSPLAATVSGAGEMMLRRLGELIFKI